MFLPLFHGHSAPATCEIPPMGCSSSQTDPARASQRLQLSNHCSDMSSYHRAHPPGPYCSSKDPHGDSLLHHGPLLGCRELLLCLALIYQDSKLWIFCDSCSGVLYSFRLQEDGTNLPPELQSRTLLVLKAEVNTCLSAAVITSNLENLRMMYCVIYTTVCKNLSPLLVKATASRVKDLK